MMNSLSTLEASAPDSLEDIYVDAVRRAGRTGCARLLAPPAPLVMNPAEPKDFPLGRWNLYLGGAGSRPAGYVNLDLFPLPGVDVAADAEAAAVSRQPVSTRGMRCGAGACAPPRQVMAEIERVLAPAATFT